MMGRPNHEKIIVCLADDVRIDFAQKFTGFALKEHLANKQRDVFIYHGENELVTDHENLVVYSNQMPLGRALHVPKYKFHSDYCLSIAKKILFFNVFPYPKEDILSETKTLASGGGTFDLEVILYREKRRFSPNDLDTEDDSIRKATNTYNQHINKVTAFKVHDNPVQLLNIVPRLLDGLSNTYKSKLDLLQDELNNRFDMRYHLDVQSDVDLYFSIMNPEELGKYLKIFGFEENKHAKYVWKGFSNNFKQTYLYGEYKIMGLLLDFYLEYIDGILGWDRDNQRKHMETKLLECFEKTLMISKQSHIPATEYEFKRLLAKEYFDTEFQERIKKFFQVDAKREIYQTIQHQIDKVSKKAIACETRKPY